jgi:hypothetical protein
MEWIPISALVVFLIGLGIVAGKAIHHANKS